MELQQLDELRHDVGGGAVLLVLEQAVVGTHNLDQLVGQVVLRGGSTDESASASHQKPGKLSVHANRTWDLHVAVLGMTVLKPDNTDLDY